MKNSVTLIDVSSTKPREQTFWPTVVLPKAQIDAKIESLASIDRPSDGRRAAAVNHPMNTGPVP